MATQRRKQIAGRHGASRGYRGYPAFAWFLAGFLIGLGICALALFKGYVPMPGEKQPAATATPSQAEALPDRGSESIAARSPDRRYDFFTVLPEMEVVVPEQQLSQEALPAGESDDSSATADYILQVGSFRRAADADQMKARLALLGHIANIQVVTVNGETWHRVRIGPVTGARQADEKRRVLQDNGIETLVMKASP